ncbi:putative reverse transcriptase domain-containing protein [Tanacetum coccineum]
MDVVATKDGVSHLTYTITCIMFHLTDSVKKEKQSSLVDTSIHTANVDKLSSLDDTTILGSFPPLSTPVTTMAGNAPVWVKLHGVPVTAFSNDGLSTIATKLGTPHMLDFYTADMCMQSWGRSSYAKVMIELRADVELKDNIVVAMPRIKGDGYYTCNIRVEYEWKPLGVHIARFLDMSMRNVQRISVVFQPVSKKSTANTRSRMNNPESTKEVSKSNPFKVLTSVDNDVDLDKLRLLDNDGNPLVPTGIVESDSEMEVVFDETANLMISMSGKDKSDKGYGTDSLLMSMGKGLSNLELYKKLYNKNRHEGDHCDATKVARAHGIIANVVDLALDLYLDPEA